MHLKKKKKPYYANLINAICNSKNEKERELLSMVGSSGSCYRQHIGTIHCWLCHLLMRPSRSLIWNGGTRAVGLL